MKTVGRRKAKFEEVRSRMVIDEQMSDWALPRFSHLLLPVEMGKQIDAVSRKAQRQAVARAEKRHMKKYEKDMAIEVDSKPEKTYAEKVAEKAKEKEEKEASAAIAASLPAWVGQPPAQAAFAHRLYSDITLDGLQRSAEGKTGGTNRETADRKRILELVMRWRALGGMRRVSPPLDDWRDRLDALAAEMPNFAEVIDYLRGEFALAEVVGQPIRLTPIMLDGPPGIGKTTFARAMAVIMNTGFGTVSMETAQTATQLSGSEEYWGNSKTGLLFNLLIDGQFSNPVLLIDEVDKGRTNSNYDPLSSLYGLLEPSSAKSWFDLCLPVLKLDASRVIWILTSNDKTKVPKPLLSRMRVFDIAALDAGQSRDTAERIFQDTLTSLSIEFDRVLPPAVLSAIAATSPREMHRVVRELVAKAVLAGRRQVLVEDLRACQIGPAAPADASKPAAGTGVARPAPAAGKVMKLRVIEAEVEMPPDAVKAIAEAAEAVEADAQKKSKLH